jgi:hypothetical protein
VKNMTLSISTHLFPLAHSFSVRSGIQPSESFSHDSP